MPEQVDYSDLFKGDIGAKIKKLFDQMDRDFSKTKSTIVKSAQEITAEFAKIKGIDAKGIKSVEELDGKTKKLKSSFDQLSAIEKERERIRKASLTTAAKTVTLTEQQNKNLQKNKLLLQQRNQVQKNDIKLKQAATVEGKKLNKTLQNQQKELRGLKGSSGIFKGFAKNILAMGAAFLSIRTAIRGFTSSIKTIAGFEKAMSEVSAITGETSSGLKELQRDALRLGNITSKTASEVAGLQKEFAKLGFARKEILDATEATINLSIAAGSDLAESAIVAASTIRGFGKDARDTGKVVDVMAKSFSSSALDLEKFKIAMAKVAPVAKNAGVSFERTTANLSVLTDAGVDASTAGTSLRNIYLELSKQGITWNEALGKINNATDKNAVALQLFGKRGSTAAAILADNREKADRLTESYENSAGAAEEMARIMEDNLTGDAKRLSSAWEGLVLSFGRSDGVLRRVTQGFTRLLNAITGIRTVKVSEELKEEQLQLNVLIGRLTSANTKEEDRLKIIEEINKINPNLLKGIDLENKLFLTLADRLKKANIEYINRIVLQKKQEEIEKARRKLEPKATAAAEARLELEDLIADAASKLEIQQKIWGKTLKEQISIIDEAATAQNRRYLIEEDFIYSQGETEGAINKLDVAYNKLTQTQAKSDQGLEKIIKLEEHRAKIAKSLNIELNEQKKNEEDLLIAAELAAYLAAEKAEKAIEAENERKKISKEKIKAIEDEQEELIRIQKEALINRKISEEHFARNILQIQLDTTRKLIDISELAEKEKLKFQDQLLNKRIEKYRLDVEAAKDAEDQKAAYRDAKKDKEERQSNEDRQQIEEQLQLDDEATNKKIQNLQAISDFSKGLNDLTDALFDRSLQKSEERRQQDLAQANLTEQQKLEINKKYDKEAAKIKRKAAIADKAAKIISAGINIALGVTSALSNVLTAPLAPLIKALGALQIAAIAAAPIPKFKKGVVDYKGKGSETSDENIVAISNRESIITAQGTKKAPNLLEEINKGNITDDLLSMYKLNMPELSYYNSDKLAEKALKESERNTKAVESLLRYHKNEEISMIPLFDGRILIKQGRKTRYVREA